jgi:hypothetical protein
MAGESSYSAAEWRWRKIGRTKEGMAVTVLLLASVAWVVATLLIARPS